MTRKHLLMRGALLFLVVIAFGQPAWADAGGGSYLVGNCFDAPRVIPAAAFRAKDWNAIDSYFISEGFVAGRDGVPTGCVTAPVYLPEGATIIQAFAYLYDNSTTYKVILDFKRTRITVDKLGNYTVTHKTLYTFETSKQSLEIVTDGGTLPEEVVVAYPSDQFYLETCLGDEDTRVYSVRIYYE